MNPNLAKTPFLNQIDTTGKCITKFRAGSHQLKIETGRWSRTARGDRLCTHCNVLGDEHHAVYDCDLIHRGDLADTPSTLSSLWDYSKVNVLFERMRVAGLVE